MKKNGKPASNGNGKKNGKPKSLGDAKTVDEAQAMLAKLEQLESKKKRKQKPHVLGTAWHDQFLMALRQTGNVQAACEVAGVSDQCAMNHRDRYPEFREAWEQAKRRAIGALELTAWKRAVDGTAEPIWMKDKEGNPVKVDTVYRKSDFLMGMILKAELPGKYRENIRTEISGPSGAPIQIEQKVKVGFDYEGFSKLQQEFFGLAPVHDIGKPVHPALPDAEASTLPDDNGS